MKTLTDREVELLVSFLDDEDPRAVALAREKLGENVPAILPQLRQILAESEGRLREELESWLRQHGWGQLEQEFLELTARGEKRFSLEDGAFLLARFAHPDLDLAQGTRILDDIATELALRIYSKDEPEAILKKINAHLFKEIGFAGNKEDYYDPDNSYIDTVLERKTGIPISLSCVYLLVAKRLHLPIYGVGMPGHFLVKYQTDSTELYVDPFEKGKIMTRLDCMRHLMGAGYGFQESFLTRAKPRDMLKRMINNLIMIYDQRGMMQHEKQLVRYFEILNKYRPKA